MRQRRWASTAPAVATATANECGCTVLIRLVRSITPSMRPVSGSCTGAAAHVHACTTSLKCSAANTWTAWSAASAVPIAFVPAPPSLHSAPTAKFIEFAAASRTLRRALEPQQRPVRIADHHQVRRVVGDPGEALADQRRHSDERMDLPARRRLVVVRDQRRGAVGARIDARRRGSPPGLGDRLAHGLRATASEEPLPGTTDFPRSERWGSRGVDGQPGIPQSSPLGPIVGDRGDTQRTAVSPRAQTNLQRPCSASSLQTTGPARRRGRTGEWSV